MCVFTCFLEEGRGLIWRHSCILRASRRYIGEAQAAWSWETESRFRGSRFRAGSQLSSGVEKIIRGHQGNQEVVSCCSLPLGIQGGHSLRKKPLFIEVWYTFRKVLLSICVRLRGFPETERMCVTGT